MKALNTTKRFSLSLLKEKGTFSACLLDAKRYAEFLQRRIIFSNDKEEKTQVLIRNVNYITRQKFHRTY